MGLGAYLAAVTDRDHYMAEEQKERDEVINKPEAERAEIHEIFDEYEIGHEASSAVVRALERNPEMWVKVCMESQYEPVWLMERLMRCQFMMTFELKLEKPNISRAWISAATMGASYFIGGLNHLQAERSYR